MDPTALALLSIFGGAALTAIAGLIGAVVQARREHNRWVRERRYEAFVKVQTLMEELEAIKWSLIARTSPDLERAEAAMEQLMLKFAEYNAPIVVLGPGYVVSAIKAVNAASDEDEHDVAQWRLQRAMRRALKIR